MDVSQFKEKVLEQPYFTDIKPEYLDILVKTASEVSFEKGHFLLTKGSDANNLYMLSSGKVNIEIDGEEKGPITIQSIGVGDIIGWSWLVPPFEWQFDAIVIEPTNVLKFDGVALRNTCEENHGFGYDLIKRVTTVMTNRLLSTRLKLMEYYT